MLEYQAVGKGRIGVMGTITIRPEYRRVPRLIVRVESEHDMFGKLQTTLEERLQDEDVTTQGVWRFSSCLGLQLVVS